MSDVRLDGTPLPFQMVSRSGPHFRAGSEDAPPPSLTSDAADMVHDLLAGYLPEGPEHDGTGASGAAFAAASPPPVGSPALTASTVKPAVRYDPADPLGRYLLNAGMPPEQVQRVYTAVQAAQMVAVLRAEVAPAPDAQNIDGQPAFEAYEPFATTVSKRLISANMLQAKSLEDTALNLSFEQAKQFRSLAPEKQGDILLMLNLVNELHDRKGFDAEATKADLLGLLESGVFREDGTLDSLKQLFAAYREAEVGDLATDKLQAFQTVLKHLDQPGSIFQGNSQFCGPVSALESLIRRDGPGVYARMTSDLLITGAMQLPNGERIQMDRDHVAKAVNQARDTGDGRDNVTNFMLATLHAYAQRKAGHPPDLSKGLQPKELEYLYGAMMPGTRVSTVPGQLGRDQVLATLAREIGSDRRVPVGVYNGPNGTNGHVLTVTGVDQDASGKITGLSYASNGQLKRVPALDPATGEIAKDPKTGKPLDLDEFVRRVGFIADLPDLYGGSARAPQAPTTPSNVIRLNFGDGDAADGGFGDGDAVDGGFGDGDAADGGFGDGDAVDGGFGDGDAADGGFGGGDATEGGFGGADHVAGGFGGGGDGFW